VSGAEAPVPRSEAWLRRYARQVVLPGFGEDGQERLGRAFARVVGGGGAAEACALHLRAAGVGRVEAGDMSGKGDTSNAAADVVVVVGPSAGAPPAAAGARVVVVEKDGDGVTVGEREAARPEAAVPTEGPLALAAGALAADLALRVLLGRPKSEKAIRLAPGGSVGMRR